MKHDFEDLLNFIEFHPSDWKTLLRCKPYCLKSLKKSIQNPNWYILMYNLFERESLNYKEVLASRGCVVEVIDGKARMICAPFYKFFNYGEGPDEEINWSNPKCFVLEKRDGWICKMSKVDGKLYWWTQSMDLTKDSSAEVPQKVINGLSFKNMYEVKEYAWNRENHDFVESLPDGCTLTFELESAWNEIHTTSNWEPKLWFIQYRGPDLMERTVFDAKAEFKIPFEIPNVYTFNSWKEIKAALDTWKGKEQEGIVVCEPTESGHFKRAKIKCASYLEIKMAAHISGEIVPTTRNIFNLVVRGEYDDFLSKPEIGPKILEMVERIKAVKSKFNDIYDEVMASVNKNQNFELYKIEVLNYLKSKYGYINYSIILKAADSDFETAWIDMIENWKYSTRIAWKKLESFEKNFGIEY